MSVVITNKTDYKLKEVNFVDENLIDENGEVIDLNKNLKAIFDDKTFTLVASMIEKAECEVSDFTNKE